jgi:hypothetical protein
VFCVSLKHGVINSLVSASLDDCGTPTRRWGTKDFAAAGASYSNGSSGLQQSSSFRVLSGFTSIFRGIRQSVGFLRKVSVEEQHPKIYMLLVVCFRLL